MMTVIRNISYLLLLCLAVLAVGCVDDGMPSYAYRHQGGDGDATLALTVSIGNSRGPGSTRAEGEDEEETTGFMTADPINQYELIHTLRVIIMRENNTVEFNRMVNMPPNTGLAEVGALEFEVSTSLGETVRKDGKLERSELKRIYLVANEASIPNERVRNMLETLKEGRYVEKEVNLPPGQGSESEDVKTETVKTAEYVPGDIFEPETAEGILIYNEWTQPDQTRQDTYAVPMVDNSVNNGKLFVPMTEFFDITVTSNLTKPNDNNIQEHHLFITRNLVKFEFEIDSTDDMDSFRVTDITFSSLMQKEYLFPNNTQYSPRKYNGDGTVNMDDKEIVEYYVPWDAENLIRPYYFEPSDFGFNSKLENGVRTEHSTTYSPELYFCESKTLVGDDVNLTRSLFSISIGVEFDREYPVLDDKGQPVLDDQGKPKYEEPLRMEFDAKELDLPEMLPRNTIVKVKMTLKNGELTATATVFPYTAVSLHPEFGVIVEPDGVTLDKNEVTMAETTTLWLGANITPEDATETTLTWSSDKPDIATVDDKGMVTAVKAGGDGEYATITVTTSNYDPEKPDNNLKATCKVTVTEEVKATELTLDKATASIAQGNTLSLYAIFTPANVSNRKLNWSSSSPEVASVDEDGVVTASKTITGSTTITAATDYGVTATCDVTVTQKIPVTGVSLSASSTTSTTSTSVTVGNTVLLYATINPAEATNKKLIWESNNQAIATVDAGCVTGVSPGTATITVKTDDGDHKATCTVTVTGTNASTITLDKTSAIVGEGGMLYLTATLSANATNRTLTWSSSNENVATVDNGFVTGLSPGTTTITVSTSTGLKASCNITVSRVTLNKTSEILSKEGDSSTLQLTATITPETVAAQEKQNMKWSSSDENVATVDNKGLVTAKQFGNATITVTTTNYATASCEITVK